MELVRHANVSAYLDAARELLLTDEARHNLAFGICATLRDHPHVYPVADLLTVTDGGETVGAALMTPPSDLFLARPRDPKVATFLDYALAEAGIEVPGVSGALPESADYAAAWERRTGATRRLRRASGIYRLTRVRPTRGVAGGPRLATDEDRALLAAWLDAFHAEAMPHAPRGNSEERIDRLLREGGALLWGDAGDAVSLACVMARTPNGARVGLVYTPPERRGHGYGSSVTAALSQQLLDEGRRFCFLYTNLGNPTSNAIYRAIGYELVCESAAFALA
jgi:GNAT superfamily N-acetyltransferase